MKIVFFGTSRFAAQVLGFLLKQNDLDIVACVTRPDKSKGRTSQTSAPPVKDFIKINHFALPIHQPKKASSQEFCNELSNYKPDLFVVVAYGEILKQTILSIPRLGSINIHASLLPKYRGAAPMQRCLMNGESRTGITIIDMVLEMDAGDMLDQIECSIPREMNLEMLEQRLIPLACESVLKVIHQFISGSVKRISQNINDVTFAPKISSDEEKINWDNSAEKIHNQIRALSPVPGAWCSVMLGSEEKRLKIKEARVVPLDGEPKQILSFKPKLIVACGAQAIEFLQVQLEGKKQMKVGEFLNGVNSTIKIL